MKKLAQILSTNWRSLIHTWLFVFVAVFSLTVKTGFKDWFENNPVFSRVIFVLGLGALSVYAGIAKRTLKPFLQLTDASHQVKMIIFIGSGVIVLVFATLFGCLFKGVLNHP